MTKQKPSKLPESKEDTETTPRMRVTDRRFWAQEESTVEEASESHKKYPTIVEELKARTELAEHTLKEKLTQIDEENEAYRARLQKDFERQLTQEKLDLFHNFLEIIDNFERALQSADKASTPENLREGVQLNLDLLLSKLKFIGIEPMEVLHQPFNPHESEAIGTVPVDDPTLDSHVTEVLQAGFRWDDQVLRPARVRIGQYRGDQRLEKED